MSDFDAPLPIGELVEPLIELAREAGARIMDTYATSFSVEYKSDHTPVTAADLAAHNIIEAGLLALAPDLPVLSEEGTAVTYEERASWTTYWLVDPLDGTREFMRRNGEFSVNIALIHRQRSVLGVVHRPINGVSYHATAGQPAYRRSPDDGDSEIHVRAECRQPPVVAVSRARPNHSLEHFLQHLGPHVCLTMGSSLKSCLVATGEADIYPCFGPTSEWDTAAAQCIVEQAGGRLTDLNLQPLRYNTRESLRNPKFLVYGDRREHWTRFLQTD